MTDKEFFAAVDEWTKKEKFDTEDALEWLIELRNAANKMAGVYARCFAQLFGTPPGRPMDPLDILKHARGQK